MQHHGLPGLFFDFDHTLSLWLRLTSNRRWPKSTRSPGYAVQCRGASGAIEDRHISPGRELHTGRVGISIAIIGGGIIGLSVAWRLAQAGFAVTVYEKSTIGGEASWAAAGMLAPGGEFEENTALARLAIESRELYRSFVEELQDASGIEIDFQETGAIDVAYSAEELNVLGQRATRQAVIGIPSEQVSPARIATFCPQLRTAELVGGYFYPADAAVNPRHVVSALQVCSAKAAVRLVERSAIASVQLDGESVLVNAERHDAVVIASGAWSGGVCVHGVPALPASEPVRGHLLGYRQSEQICHTIVRREHMYLLQRANGLLIVGASVEHVGFDRSIDRATVTQLEKQAAFIMPRLLEIPPSEVWNGFRPGSDELHVGRWHSDRVYLAYGHYRNGILLAPATAQLVAKGISASLQKR
jgi:glycine oxidase